ncbi:MAG: hypothetical protein C4308_06565 [Chitinophagaceae bacterium]
MLKQLLAATKFSALSLSKINPVVLLDDVIEEIRFAVADKRIELVKNYQHTNCEINADESKLQQAIQQVLLNAVQAIDT